MRESVIEQALVDGVTRRGGAATKTQAIGRRGYFDRTVVMPGGRVWFVELKRPKGGRLAPHQTDFMALYRGLGANVVVLRSLQAVEAFLTMLDMKTPPEQSPGGVPESTTTTNGADHHDHRPTRTEP